MDQFENLKKLKADSVFDMMQTQEALSFKQQQGSQDAFNFEPVEKKSEQQLDEKISKNLEEVQVIDREMLIAPEKEEIEKAHRQLGVKTPSSPVKRAN